MFKRKKEVYSVKEFMTKNQPEVAVNGFEFKEELRESLSVLGTLSLIPLTIKPFFQSTPVMAAEAVPTFAVKSEMYNKMMDAFDPLITLIQGLAYPIAMVVVLGGAIMVMIDRKDRGFEMMQTAGLGYVLVQLAPMILDMLVDIIKAV